MKKIKLITLCMLTTLSLSACSVNLPFLNKESDDSAAEGSTLSAEQQALIGTYTETGELIVGFDESGFMITEAPDPMANLGYTSRDLLSRKDSYTHMVITTYDTFERPIYVINYKMDSFNKTAVKYYYYMNNEISMTYYDNKANKVYVNQGMTGWEQATNDRLDSLIFYINPDKFSETEFTADDMFVYVKGAVDLTAIDNTPMLSNIYKQFPNVTSMNLTAIYYKDTQALYRAEMDIVTTDSNYKVSCIVDSEQYNITIPAYATAEKTQEEIIKEGIEKLPLQAYMWSALYVTDDESTVTRDFIISEYQMNAAQLEKAYKGIVIETFLDAMLETDDMTVDEFLTDYATREGKYDSIEQQAVYTYFYDRLNDIDSTIEDDMLAKIVVKPEPGEEPEEPVEEQPVEEEKIIKYATTDVNMRSGPGTSYDKMGQLPKDQPIEVLGVAEENADWSKCQKEDGTVVYIKSQYLRD